MRSMQFARAAALEERKKVGEAVEGLGDRLVRHLVGMKVDVVAVSAEQLDGGRAEIDAASGVIKYNETLGAAERLVVLAHELGHLVMHGRLMDSAVPIDPVLASAYGDAGPAAIARYSPRVREEAEANAFAVEFICPGDTIFAMWRIDPEATIDALAARMAVTPEIVRVQLANALHDLTIGADASRASRSRDVALTSEQRDAATFAGRPALVDAGPGTGKTATLIGRVEHLLTEIRVAPEQILVVTFSNEAAQELTERIGDRFGRDVADRITISTFHGFGMEFLHLHGEQLGYADDPRLIDEDAQAEVMYEIIGRVPRSKLVVLRDPWETAGKLVEHINHCKHYLITPDALAAAIVEAGGDAAGEELVAVYREYERVKHERQQADFADLIMLPLRLLESHPGVRAAWRTKAPWVLVDEFQDVSRATSRLLRALCGEENPPWVVGDARQAIYRFLGASPENVTEFQKDFAGAKVFPLEANYRSSDPVIGVTNELAGLMAGSGRARWRRGSDAQPLGKQPVAIAEARSDNAERVGVVEKIREWIQQDGVAPGDIAVLARRHLDVRETMLALRDAGIKAQSAGLLTAEGAAGDLAAVLTLADSQLAAVPRLVYAFGRHALKRAELNATVRTLFQNEQVEGDVAQQIERAQTVAEREKFSGDGWVALTSFLFESSSYLRRVLANADTAERAMTLIEIVSTLSLATAYRATHIGAQPRSARIGFAERLRGRLTETIPLPLIPKPRADAVRVMTCHASKGLEFPCVIVSGQTVPKMPERYPWLPPSLRPAKSEDDEQANSLLFVGVTRAKRAVLVSYPTHAGQTALAKGKKVVPLLEAWRDCRMVPLFQWEAALEPNVAVAAGPVWGLPARGNLKASALDSDACPLLTYLEQYLGIRFPEEETVLYPRFFGAVRRILRRIAVLANEVGRQAEEAEVRSVLDEEWPADRFEDHPHYEMYRTMAADIAMGFAREFLPVKGSVMLEPEIRLDQDETKPTVALDLVAYFRQPDGRVVTVAFRPESFAAKAEDGMLGWSKVDDNKRISLVLPEFQGGVGSTAPKVFSGIDRRIYGFQWSKRKDSLGKEVTELVGRFRALASADFATEATPYKCDRCRARVTCPHWIGALET